MTIPKHDRPVRYTPEERRRRHLERVARYTKAKRDKKQQEKEDRDGRVRQ